MCLAHEHVFQSTKGKMFTSKKNKDPVVKDSSRPQSARRSAILKCVEESVASAQTSAQTDKSESAADGGSTKFISLQYDIAIGRLHMLNGDYSSAVNHLKRAVMKDILVSSSTWNCIHIHVLEH